MNFIIPYIQRIIARRIDFEQAIQGATDNEIIAKLGLTCKRQRMQQIRSMVMGLAQRVFRPAHQKSYL